MTSTAAAPSTTHTGLEVESQLEPLESEHDVASRRARDLTYAILSHYGFTADDIAVAELVHPGRVCDDDCWDEDGESVHGPAYVELGATAGVVVDVVLPWLDDILSTQTCAQTCAQTHPKPHAPTASRPARVGG